MAAPTAPKDRVKASWLFAYSLPGLPIAAMGLPLAVHLPNFYAVEVGLGYAVAGSIFLLTRVLDIFLDPIMGVVSDRVQTRWGRRRLWMVLSVPIMIAASVLLFMPAPGTTWPATAASLVLLFIGWTMLTITHLAWGGELSGDYHERSRVTASREAAYIIGMFTVLLLPVIIQAQGGDRFAQIAAFGWYVIITLPIGVAAAVLVIKEKQVPPQPHIPLKVALAAIATNGPLRYVLFSDLIAGLSTGTVATLFIAMTTVGLQLGQEANLLLLIYFFMGVVFIPPMVWVSKKLGKHQTLAYSSLVNAILIPCIFLLPKGEFWPAAVLWTLFGLNMGVGPFLFRAIMADVADHDHVETGQARAGVYFALLALTNKAGYSVAIGLTFWTLAAIGFQQNAPNTPEVVSAMMWLYILPPTLVSALVAVVMWRFPLGEEKQRELRRIIEERSIPGTAIGARVGHTLEVEQDLPDDAPAAAPLPKPAE
jgi:glycoside/pentoside/hexuronide:cation symporter, GPH family